MTRDVTLNKINIYPTLQARDASNVKGRVKFGENVTSSLCDEALSEFRKSKLSSEEESKLDDWKFVLNKSVGAIEQHFEKRVSQLFIQAVLCHNTGYRFREGHTLHQGSEAHQLLYGNDKKIEFHAAHDATLPCLYAYSEDTKQEIVFLYRSGFYDESNATIDVVHPINEADRAIDEKRKNSLLREKAITLLNKNAEGDLTPQEVAKEFIKELIEETKKSISLEKDAKVVDVLKIYLNLAENLVSYIDQPENIDLWLNLNIDASILSEVNKTVEDLNKNKVVERSKIIDLIKEKINDLPLLIHKERHQKENESHIPCHFYDLFHYQVLSRFKGEELQVVEEATDINFENLKERISSFKYTKRTNALLQRHVKKIDQLAQEIMLLISKEQNKLIDKHTFEPLISSKKICLRPSLYRLRYDMIYADQQAESVIKSKLESTLNAIKEKSRAHFLEEFFYCSILDRAKNETIRLMLCKLLNISSVRLDQKLREVKVNEQAHDAMKKYAREISRLSGEINQLPKPIIKNKIEDIFLQINSSCKVSAKILRDLFYRRFFDYIETLDEQNLLTELIGSKEEIDGRIAGYQEKTKEAENIMAQQATKIQEVVDVALEEIGKLIGKTIKFKSKLMAELREAHGMSQSHFQNIYKKDYPAYPMSETMLSNLENGHKTINSTIAKQASKIYGVSPSLFFPSHFAEITT